MVHKLDKVDADNQIYMQETLVHAPTLWAEEISKRASLFL